MKNAGIKWILTDLQKKSDVLTKTRRLCSLKQEQNRRPNRLSFPIWFEITYQNTWSVKKANFSQLNLLFHLPFPKTDCSLTENMKAFKIQLMIHTTIRDVHIRVLGRHLPFLFDPSSIVCKTLSPEGYQRKVLKFPIWQINYIL